MKQSQNKIIVCVYIYTYNLIALKSKYIYLYHITPCSNMKFCRFIKRLYCFEHLIPCDKNRTCGYFSFEIAIVAYDSWLEAGL